MAVRQAPRIASIRVYSGITGKHPDRDTLEKNGKTGTIKPEKKSVLQTAKINICGYGSPSLKTETDRRRKK